jgi:two-component system chemotaxis response regulator CheY
MRFEMSKRVMIVDDSDVIRKMATMVLGKSGYSVLEAVDGQDALDKLRDSTIDLLISDVNMPNLGGIELIRQIRSDPDHRFMPVILLTSESQQDKKTEAKAAGMTGWLVKPFMPAQLIAAVKRLVR